MYFNILLILIVNSVKCFMNEKLAGLVDWNVDSVGYSLDINFSPFILDKETRYMKFLTKSHIELFTLGNATAKTNRVYRALSPYSNYKMIYENSKNFVTLHLDENGYFNFILWDTYSGNRLHKFITKKSIMTYVCSPTDINNNEVHLYMVTDDFLLDSINLSSGSTIFSYQLPLNNQSISHTSKKDINSYRLQATVVNYHPKVFLYSVKNYIVSVADVNFLTGEPQTIAPYSVVYRHDDGIDLSKDCYITIRGLACFIQKISNIQMKSYIFTVNRDNYQQQYFIDDVNKLRPKFHSHRLLELYLLNNSIKYVFYTDGIIADLSQFLSDKMKIVPIELSNLISHRMYFGLISLVTNNVTVYELQFESDKIFFYLIFETILNITKHRPTYQNLHQMKFMVYFNGDEFHFYLLCQHFDDHNNQLIQLFHNKILIWSSESTLGEILNILPIEIMEQRELNNDETLAYQSPFFFERLLYRLRIGFSAIVKFLIQFSLHFKLNKTLNIYKNRRHSNVMIVTTKDSYIYAIYSKNGDILWSRKLWELKPFTNIVNSSEKYALPVYLLRKAEVVNGTSFSSIAAVVGRQIVDDNKFNFLIWLFDPLTGASINDKHFINSIDSSLFEKISNIYPSTYRLNKNFTLGRQAHMLMLPINFYNNILILTTESYDKFNYFPSKKLIKYSKLNSQVYAITHETINNTINGFCISTNNKHSALIRTVRWKVNIPIKAINIKIHHIDNEYYVDRTKFILHNIAYKPFILKNIATVSYVIDYPIKNGTSLDNQYILYVMFIDVKTGNVLKTFTKHNVDSASISINLVGNTCTIISTNNRSKSSTVSVINFFYDIKNYNQSCCNYNSQNNHIITLKETYLLGSYRILFATATKTYFGFSQKSLIIAQYDGRIVSIPFRLLDSRRNYKSLIADPSTITNYYPQINQVATNIINKDRMWVNMTQLISFPSQLESTSVVCASSPSGLYCSHLVGLNGAPFDILSVQFNHYIIVTFIIVLCVVLFLSRNLSRKKKLYNNWI